MPATTILAVDDDRNLLEVLKMRLESASYGVITAMNESDAATGVREQVVDLCIIDLQLGEEDGISVMKNIHRINPEIPVIILTAYGSIESAVEAMRRGAFSYLTKPFDPQDLLQQIENALVSRKLVSGIKNLKSRMEERYDFVHIVAKSDKMQNVLMLVSRIAGTDSTVYIQGESGTGKELVARAIHLSGARKDKPFVAINCAAIPETLLESELFGYERGAFTGAIQDSKGLFTQAHTGSLFLDEIGNMPLSLQTKSLRVLQERQFYPVGGSKPVSVDVRVIVATNLDLKKEVEEGRFREDLFYRIHVIPIVLPPLRERKEDIYPLIEHFLGKFNVKMKKNVTGLTPAAMQRIMLHDWPGNVRELENTLEFAVAMSEADVITEDLILGDNRAPEKFKPYKEAKAAFEKGYIISLLELTKGNVSKASELAGKYRPDFYNILRKYDLKPEDFKKT
ncbi:MAG: sigma-54-dependent Fis family transcriptional regulator [Nitrospirae bacterium]|nr:sigma-54-dependent Fis family transcriptional regulator [Nitrospirota bacterium]